MFREGAFVLWDYVQHRSHWSMDWFKRTSTGTPGYYPPNIGFSCNLFPSKQHYSLTIFYTPLRLLIHASCYLVNDNKPSNASKSMSRSWHLLSFNLVLREHVQDAAIFHGKKPGWWLTYPSEKYESQWEGLSHILWNTKNVWNHQPETWLPLTASLVQVADKPRKVWAAWTYVDGKIWKRWRNFRRVLYFWYSSPLTI